MNRHIPTTNRLALLGALILSSLVLIVTTAPLAQAATNAIVTVTSTADDGTATSANCPGASCRLRDAIAKAAANDTINFDGTVFASAQTIQLAGELVINKSLTIDGVANGVYTPTLAGPGPGATYFRVINISLSSANVTLNNLIIARGNLTGTTPAQAGGAGIYSTGKLTVTNSVITNNLSTAVQFGYGGGLYFATNSLTALTDSEVLSNTGIARGGGIYSAGTLTVTRSTIANNVVVGSDNRYGGGIFQVNAGITVLSSTLWGNTIPIEASYSGIGGGLYTDSSVTRINIAGSTFYSNTSRNDGGGLALLTVTYPATVTNVSIYNNRSLQGNAGGLYAVRLTMSDSSIYSNTAIGAAGLYINTALTLTNVNILSNTATGTVTTGGLYAGTNAIALITGGLFQNNRASNGQGGAMRTGTNSRVTITGTQFISNTSAGSGSTNGGGAVYAMNALTLTNVLFQENSASGGSGGGLHSTSTSAQLNISNTQFVSNTAALNGGGLYILGPATLAGSALQSNRCTGTGCFIGDGLYASATLTLTGSTPYTYSDNFNLRGDLYASDNLTLTENAMTFSGSTPQTIGGASPTAFCRLAISNTTGVSLGQHQSVSSILTLTTDLTTTANYTLTLEPGTIVTSSGEVVGAVRRSGLALASDLSFNSRYTTLNFATAPTQLDVVLTRSKHPNADANGGGADMLPRYYTLLPVDNVDATTICLSYRDADLGAITESALRLCRWAGTGWNCPTRGAASSTVDNTVCADNVTEFSDWTLGAVGPTAVMLQDFSATANASAESISVMGAVLAVLSALAIGRRIRAKAQP